MKKRIITLVVAVAAVIGICSAAYASSGDISAVDSGAEETAQGAETSG